MKKRVIKAGDRIKIITPQIFKRCGYPLSYEEAEKYIEDNHKDKVFNVISSVVGEDEYDIFNPRREHTKSYRKIIEGLALEYLKSKSYGGKTRSIHTELDPELVDKYAIVKEVKVHQSGTYVSGGGGYSYYDWEPDYDPPYLTNVKCHRILYCETVIEVMDVWQCTKEFRIEDIHVELAPEGV